MENQWVKGKVAENHHWTDKLYSLKVEAKKTRDQTHYADRELKRTVDRIRQKSVV